MNRVDIILHNGRIHTFDSSLARAEALAISGDRIAAVGSNEMVLALGKRGTEIVDLNGASVLPGLTDAHIHLEQFARSLRLLDCEVDRLDECLALVRERAKHQAPGTWILGHGWNQTTWARTPTASELDSVAPSHPVYLTAKSLHAGWANSAALRCAGIKPDTPDPPDGRFLRDPEGRPSGVLLEGAMALIAKHIPVPEVEDLLQLLVTAQAELWRLGITGVHDFDGVRCFEALQLMHARGELGLRVLKNIPVQALPHAQGVGLRTGFGDHWLRIGDVKVFADGALGPRTAAMREPYHGEPENLGILLMDQEEILETALTASNSGFGMAIHAIGDRANSEALHALESLARIRTNQNLPRLSHRIEHVQCLQPQDLGRLGELGVTASMQPIHATSDMLMADQFWGERVRTSYAWRSLLDRNTSLLFGSDAPVESPNPFFGIHAAVTRRRADGKPGREGWVPEERISLSEAFAAYIAGGTRLRGDRVRLASGTAADLIVLSSDPFEIDMDAVRSLLPSGTMVAGKWRQREF